MQEVLYGISHEKTIFLVEGEKDVNTLLNQKPAIIATTGINSLEWNEDYTRLLKDADIVILFDYDKVGYKRKDMLCKELYSRVKRLRVVDLPGLEYQENHGQDITDWFAMGHTADELREIVDKTTDYKPKLEPALTGGLRTVSIDELFALEIPPREMLLAPFLPSQGLVLIFAKRGVGKTHIALGVAYAVATGGEFLRWNAPTAKKVLYIDGEMPASLMQERLQKIVAMSDTHPKEGFFTLLTPDLQNHVMPDLSDKKGRDAIEPLVEAADLTVIDRTSANN